MQLSEFLAFFGGGVWATVAFVVALSIIVAIHEYGHYIVGKKSGIFPEVFSLGFGPVLWSRRDRDGTLWQIAALPFGGYVKFRGDANASGGVDDAAMAGLTEAERRSTMTGAPLWARASTVAAGPLFNFALSIVIFTGMALSSGVMRDPLTVGAVKSLPTPQGLASGDVILEIEGRPLPSISEGAAFDATLQALPERAVLEYLVERDGQRLRVDGPYPVPPLVSSVVPMSAASDAGLLAGDVITAIDGAPIVKFNALKEKVESSEGAPMTLTVWRAGTTQDMLLTPRKVDEPQADNSFVTTYRIGVASGLGFEPATEALGPLRAVEVAGLQVWRIISGTFSGIWHMATGAISTCNLSGPIGIAKTSGAMASQGTASFIGFIAVLSTAVGLMNLLPVPVLDGGHLVFHAYEAVAGRPPNERVLNVLMTVGLGLILTLMVFALTNDIFCP